MSTTKSVPSCRYRVIAPNYRGAGRSSKPVTGFTKSVMAEDIIQLLDALGITSKVHLVGHDIGGMIAWSAAARHPDRIATLTWGECPLPGTSAHDEDRTGARAVEQFHFTFHCVRDLPEALIAGREDIYLRHFFRGLAHDTAAIGPRDVAHFVEAYSQPGAMRCALECYRAFPEDAEENKEWVRMSGRCRVPAVCLSGEMSAHWAQAGRMVEEVHEEGTCEAAALPGAGHYLAEENPGAFVERILALVEKHPC
jgi:pimeloyl-ACP methyl ester carboxylesterase